MAWLLALPVWCVFCNVFRSDNFRFKISNKAYIAMCAIALIFVMGLRSRYTGSMDTYMYSRMFNAAISHSDLISFLKSKDVMENFWLFSEIGFYVYIWLVSKVFADAQWLIFITSAFVVFATAKFISRHSEDYLISWITFICLGLMTFAMNGMRQSLAMSICLLSYGYVKEKKPIRFLLVVLLAVLFHKSAIIFLLVYLMRNMKLDVKSFACITVGVTAFLLFAQKVAFLYDSLSGEDYAESESFESGGVVTILIYLIAVAGMLLRYRKLQNPEKFLPFALIIMGLSLYLGRFLSTQIYERISYYFAYFLMLCFPVILKDPDPKMRYSIRTVFFVFSIALFAYRIYSGAFSDFKMFWQEEFL